MVNMPNCGCFHQYELESTAPGEYQLIASVEGQADLKGVLESANLASSVSAGTGFFKTTIHLSGVTNGAALTNFCNQLKSTIIVDLTPALDFRHALSPYTIFDEDQNPHHTDIGELVNQAKYRKDPDASGEISAQLSEFIDNHPGLRNIAAIATPPESDSINPNLTKIWAEELASAYGWEVLPSTKTRFTPPQKDIKGEHTEDYLVTQIANSVEVKNVHQGTQVLLLDDTIGSGGTLIELGRVLKRAGAAKIFGLAAAKDARHTNRGINLRRDSWP